jgi:hypothetical protein
MFSVFKPQTALTEVLSAWNQADGPARLKIEVALIHLEYRLQENPFEQGESREDGTRVLFHFPLALTIEIDEERRLVRVVRAWTFRGTAAA